MCQFMTFDHDSACTRKKGEIGNQCGHITAPKLKGRCELNIFIDQTETVRLREDMTSDGCPT
mgnify:CR=1 FL=1